MLRVPLHRTTVCSPRPRGRQVAIDVAFLDHSNGLVGVDTLRAHAATATHVGVSGSAATGLGDVPAAVDFTRPQLPLALKVQYQLRAATLVWPTSLGHLRVCATRIQIVNHAD